MPEEEPMRLLLHDRVRKWEKLSKFQPSLPQHRYKTAELMEGFKTNTDKTWQDVQDSTVRLK